MSRYVWPVLLALTFARAAWGGCTLQSSITGEIGPATSDLLERLEKRVETENCSALLLLINTPGGDLETTHEIVERILNFPVPVLCVVAPAGAHAGSAGAMILQSCHVSGGLRGTNLGAATPIAEDGGDIGKDLRRKVLNDTESWLQSVVRLRGRSEEFVSDIVRHARSVSSEEALDLHAIDVVADDVPGFLAQAQGKKVKLAEARETAVDAGPVMKMDLDTRYYAIDFLTDPELAYVLFLASLALLYFEFTHPGSYLAGVTGAIGIIVSLISFQKLGVEWGGLALILLGFGLLFAELFVSSFGAFGLGGLAAFVIGSLFLFDPSRTGHRLPLVLILPAAALFGGLVFVLGYLMLKTRRMAKKTGFEEMVGRHAQVVKISEAGSNRGLIEVRGETWSFESPSSVSVGDRVRITGHMNLVLSVQKAEEV